jgi:hypothetical protein
VNHPRFMLQQAPSRRPGLIHRARRSRQSGQSMVEFIIIAPLLLFVCFATIQFVLLYQAKSTLDVAVLEAAREGAVNNGSMKAMRAGLARGLAPLYAHEADASGVSAALAAAQSDAANWAIITVYSPNPLVVNDFARPRFYPDQAVSYTEIPNDSLMYRDSSRLGPLSGVNIQDANLLKVHVHYCYNMYVPFVNKAIYYAVNLIGAVGTTVGTMGIVTREPATQDPYGAPKAGDVLCKTKLVDGIASGQWPLPLDSETMVRMQSPFRDAAVHDSPNPVVQ